MGSGEAVGMMWGGCGENVDFVSINSPQILWPTIVQQHQSGAVVLTLGCANLVARPTLTPQPGILER